MTNEEKSLIDTIKKLKNDLVIGEIVAWMPLPTPYKEDNTNAKEFKM